MESVPSASFGFVVSALLIGIAFGYILQRGRFCMNTAFRDMIFIKDFTLTRAYIIALIVMIVGANLMEDFGLIHLGRQTFRPFSQIIGGYLFGLGIVIAGGCGSGIIYRVGEGLLAAWMAVLGFFLGISATADGVLKPLYDLLRSYQVGESPITLYSAFGDGGAAKWGVIAVLVVIGAVFVLKGEKPFSPGKQKGFYWSVTGLLVGIMGVIAFWASEYFGVHTQGVPTAFARGLNFTTPTRELFMTIIKGDASPQFAQVFAIGPFKTTWAALYIVGVPIGSYISAKMLKEFVWKVPPAKELLTVFLGSLLMGFGATTAGGCNVGQALTGAATLSLGSVVATIFIILGNWTMVYFKFIKPMKDL